MPQDWRIKSHNQEIEMKILEDERKEIEIEKERVRKNRLEIEDEMNLLDWEEIDEGDL